MKLNILKQGNIISLLVILSGIFLLPNTAYLSSISEEKIIELTNAQRHKNGMEILTKNNLLTNAAQEKAKDLIKNQKFEHNLNGQKFSNWIKSAGYEYSYVGENLAVDFVTSEGVVSAWLKSDSHRANILNKKFSEIGVAIVEGKFQGKNSLLVVQIFGSPVKTQDLTYTNNDKGYNFSVNENFLSHSLSFNKELDRNTILAITKDDKLISDQLAVNNTKKSDHSQLFIFFMVIGFALLAANLSSFQNIRIINRNKQLTMQLR